MKKILTTILILVSAIALNAQVGYFEKSETNVFVLFEKLRFSKSDQEKDTLNTIICKVFEDILNHENSFNYNFDKLNISKIFSEDKTLKIYTWNLQYENGEFKYFGFIQYYNKNGKEYKTLQLKDNSSTIENPEIKELSAENWYGALYYSMILKKHKKDKQYVLLGWDGNNNFSNKKIIDILYFNDEGDAVFGKKVLKYENKMQNRIIFEYSQQVQMLLKYDPAVDMIVWDHLSPSSQELKGQYRFYGPDFSYDGIFFNKGIWDFYSNLNIKNQ